MRHKIKIFIFLLIFTLFYFIFIQNLSFFKSKDAVQVLPTVTCPQNHVTLIKEKTAASYTNLLDCKIYYNSSSTQNFNYSIEANDKLKQLRFVRGVVIYFPADQFDYYEQEVRWLYRSWIEMQKFEPKTWRTDLIIFTSIAKLKNGQFFSNLDCLKSNIRKSKEDLPMCTVIDYIPVKDRMVVPNPGLAAESIEAQYEHLFKKTDVFDEDVGKYWRFYSKLQELKHYGYVDSILMAFEGYAYFKNNFDFLLRTDMDVFLTPLFSKWLPINCNDFIVGGGGYSHDFNMKRLKRVAANLRLNFGDIRNLGSTWYSTPAQFRLVSYFTLVSMVYVSSEEFSEPERLGKVSTILWPEWHYGVLLLYGQNLAMNHLITSGYMNVTKLDKLIDYPSSNNESINDKVHIHVYHGEDIFSKFAFRDGWYNNLTMSDLAKFDKTRIKYYTLNIAMESRFLKPIDLKNLLKWIIKPKY